MGTMVLNDRLHPGAKNPVRIAPVVRMLHDSFSAVPRYYTATSPGKFLKSIDRSMQCHV